MEKKKHTISAKSDVQDSTLGKLVFTHSINPTMDEYVGKVEISDAPVELLLYTDENLNLTQTIRHAGNIVRQYPAIWKKVKVYVIKEVLPLFNEEWRDEEDHPLEIDSFLQQITPLTEITVAADKETTFMYDPHDLFHGHSLMLEMDSSMEFTGFDLPG